MGNKFLVLFFLIFLIGFAHATTNIGEDDMNSGVSIEFEAQPTFNNNTGAVNSSKFADVWQTDEGDMDNVPDLYPTLNTEYLNLSGTNANQNISFSNFSLAVRGLLNNLFFSEAGTLLFEWISSTVVFKQNIQTQNITLNGSINDINSSSRMLYEGGVLVVEG